MMDTKFNSTDDIRCNKCIHELNEAMKVYKKHESKVKGALFVISLVAGQATLFHLNPEPGTLGSIADAGISVATTVGTYKIGEKLTSSFIFSRKGARLVNKIRKKLTRKK